MQNTILNSWINGEPSDLISVQDRGLCYGHGVFETLRFFKNQIPLQQWHMSRLEHGCTALNIPISTDIIQQNLEMALACPEHSSGIIKITITAGVNDRGYQARKPISPHYILQRFPDPGIDSLKIRQGVSLYLCEYQLPENPRLAGIKHLNRLDQVLAGLEFNGLTAPVEFDDGLVRDLQGNIIETLSRNVFVKTAQGWITPALGRCGVAGVMRQYLLDELFPGLGIDIAEKPLTVDELINAPEVFICNSVTGIWPVTRLYEWSDWPVGEDTRQIIAELGRRLPCFSDS